MGVGRTIYTQPRGSARSIQRHGGISSKTIARGRPKKTIKLAKLLLESNRTIEEVATVTGFSIEELQKLLNKKI